MPSSDIKQAQVLLALSHLGQVSSRPMMKEFLIYYRDKVIGGIYDDRFLVKKTKTSLKLLTKDQLTLPYPAAKPMLEVTDLTNRRFLTKLIVAVYDELPNKRVPKKKS